MDEINLIFIIGFVVLLSPCLFLSIRFQNKFWSLFGTALPFLLGGIFIFNMISFDFINRPYFNWAYQGVLQRLPSNQLFDLYSTSGTPIKTRWIYIVIETYYKGRTLIISEDMVESLDLSIDLLESQAQLGEVELVDADENLSPGALEQVMALDLDIIQTQRLDSKGNVTRELGDIYYFFQDPADPQSAIVLILFENKLFFLPETILNDLEGEG